MTVRPHDLRGSAPPLSGEWATAPEQLGPFRVVGRIATGGMGTVYAGVDSDTGRQVALKVLNARRSRDDVFVERLRREAEAISVIDSPYVVQLVGFGTGACGRHYLAMEMVRGSSLATVLEHCGVLPPRRAARIALGIARGLAASHVRHFVHRDVKPSNVMVTGDDRVKIVDFGIVRVVHEPSNHRLTQEGGVLGTPAYMAPEQILSSTVGATADLYALGALLFEVLTGHPPFDGDLRQIAMCQVMHTPPVVPPCGGLETLVAQLLEKDPARRPKDASEVARLLEVLVSRYERTAQPDQRQRRSSPRRLSTTAATVTLGIALRGTTCHLPPAHGCSRGGAAGTPHFARGEYQRSDENVDSRPVSSAGTDLELVAVDLQTRRRSI